MSHAAPAFTHHDLAVHHFPKKVKRFFLPVSNSDFKITTSDTDELTNNSKISPVCLFERSAVKFGIPGPLFCLLDFLQEEEYTMTIGEIRK
jgi:hypothetical protein